MSYSYSTSNTFTRTHARELASKVAGDLRQMQRLYGRPTDGEIEEYIIELVELLVGGYLESVDYGFRKDGKWVLALSYTVYGNGIITANDNSGRVPVGVNTTGASCTSHLRKSQKFWNLTASDQQKVCDSIPIKRVTGNEPEAGNGVWVQDKAYSSNGTAMQRRVFKPI